MPKPKHDYVALLATFEEVQKNTGMSLKQFCEREQLNYSTVRNAFQKVKANPPVKSKWKQTHTRKTRAHDWPAYRIEFLEGPYENLSEFARAKGLNRSASNFLKKTKGWLQEKAKIEAKQREAEAEAIAEWAKKERFGQVHGRFLAAFYNCLDGYEGIQKFLKSEKDHGPRDHKDTAGALRTIQAGLKELFPMIMDFEETENSKALIQKLIAGELDVTEVGLRYAEMGGNLPEAVKILLGKVQPEEPEEDEGVIPSDEKLEALYLEGLARIHQQKDDFLPQRQREVEKLKAECKDADSFSGIEDGEA
jgi:hypothetical protein